MLNKTAIEYADYTWSPIVGCTNNCPGCWAKAMLHRFSRGCPDCASFTPHIHREWLGRLGGPKTQPKVVVVGYLGDMWDPAVPQEWRDACFEAMAAAPWHRYLLLTKQPQNMTWTDRCSLSDLKHIPATVLVGVSGETLNAIIHRLSWLVKWPLTRRDVWASLEPLQAAPERDELRLTMRNGLNWLIVGPETPLRIARVRPPLAWYETIRDACAERGVPVYFKGAALKQYPGANLPQEWPAELRGE